MKIKIPKHQKTQSTNLADVKFKRNWHLVDVDSKILGRVASEIAQLLMGKQKPSFTPHVDVGDYVVVINAKLVKLSGKKETDKIYYRHSGYLGNLKQQTVAEVRTSHPERLIEKAVYNMLPANKLRNPRMNRLKVYAGSDHKHESQLKGVK